MISTMETAMESMEIGELVILALETMLVSLCMKIISVFITVILYGRMIEIYLFVRWSDPVCNHVQPGMGADWEQLSSWIVCTGIPGIFYDGLRGNLCGPGCKHPDVR